MIAKTGGAVAQPLASPDSILMGSVGHPHELIPLGRCENVLRLAAVQDAQVIHGIGKLGIELNRHPGVLDSLI